MLGPITLRGRLAWMQIPHATCPRWQRFIEEIFPDPEVARFVWKAAGYSLTGLIKEQCFFFLHGPGANGKSTFLETKEAIFGTCAERAGKGLIAASSRGDYPLREAAAIDGARLLLASETDEAGRFNESLIKDLTGGETMRGARLYENAVTFRPRCKLWIAGNHKPSIRGTDNGIWRRVRLVPFIRIFAPEERDPELGSVLQTEASGILNWLIKGCLTWQQEGLKPPAAIEAAVSDYRSEEDLLRDFIEVNVEVDVPDSTSHSELFKAYQEWASHEGIRFPLSSIRLAKHLRERGWISGKTSRVACLWRGVRIIQ
jgi:putative DNA primase/helicase